MRLRVMVLILGLGMMVHNQSKAEWVAWGIQAGINDNRNSEDIDFEQYELYSRWELPWSWGSNWLLDSQLEMTAGVLKCEGDTAFIGTVGPLVVLHNSNSKFSLDVGVHVAILSEDQYGQENLGGHFQFTSHAGINYKIGRNLKLGYRFQHMSNANLQENNPGLNLHMLQFSFIH